MSTKKHFDREAENEAASRARGCGMSGHTPGPWTVNGDVIEAFDADGYRLSLFETLADHKPADLRLAAAAPALAEIAAQLDGCEWSPDTLDTIASIVRRAGFEVREPQ